MYMLCMCYVCNIVIFCTFIFIQIQGGVRSRPTSVDLYMRQLVIHEILQDAAQLFPKREIVSGDVRLTYADMYERVLRLANRLDQMGVKPGTVVGVLDVNTHRYLELHYALSMLGAILHTINFRLPPQDIIYTVQHAKDEWIWISEPFAKLHASIRPYVKHLVWLADETEVANGTLKEFYQEKDLIYETLIHDGQALLPETVETITEQSPYSIFYTTGTTGKPKGIRYRHRDMVLSPLQILHHLSLHPGGAHIDRRDTFMPLIPFFHIHAWGTAVFVPYLGAKLVLPGKSTPAEQLALIRKEEVSWSNMVPTQLSMLLDLLAPGETLSLKVLTGGSPLSKGLARRSAERGIQFSLIYGGSDQLGTGISVIPEHMALNDPDALEILATRTRPLPMVNIEMRSKEGHLVPWDGQTIGEIWVSSPWLPDGYLNQPDESAYFYRDGRFRSGDLGVRYPDGSIYVVDRERDAVKSGGEWIPTGVLESILSEHPGVKAAVVLARPDEKWGERPLAIIVPVSSDPRNPNDQQDLEKTLRAYLKALTEQGRLSSYWVPDTFVFLEELPTTSAGKIHKTALRQQLGLS